MLHKPIQTNMQMESAVQQIDDPTRITGSPMKLQHTATKCKCCQDELLKTIRSGIPSKVATLSQYSRTRDWYSRKIVYWNSVREMRVPLNAWCHGSASRPLCTARSKTRAMQQDMEGKFGRIDDKKHRPKMVNGTSWVSPPLQVWQMNAKSRNNKEQLNAQVAIFRHELQYVSHTQRSCLPGCCGWFKDREPVMVKHDWQNRDSTQNVDSGYTDT